MVAATRREQKHAATREEIKQVVRELMVQQGTASVSLRQVAHTMNISSSALYYYFANRDALITDLLLDGYRSLAETMEQASSSAQEASIQLFRSVLAYRVWATEHPLDFQLLFGTPIPGYEAPRESTIAAATRVFLVLVLPFVKALQQGWRPATIYTQKTPLSPWLENVTAEMTAATSQALDPLAVLLAVHVLTRMHGTVMLELSDHIASIVGDVAFFYQLQMRTMLIEMGFDQQDFNISY